jgi:hypothetical protein
MIVTISDPLAVEVYGWLLNGIVVKLDTVCVLPGAGLLPGVPMIISTVEVSASVVVVV